MRRFRFSILVLSLFLFAACGDDDGGMGPQSTARPTHFEVTVQMSSIWAQNDCESTPGNPGDFKYRLIVRKPDEFDNQVIVADTGSQSMTISDGERSGASMEPIRFLVPYALDSTFQVEYWVGEYDPGVDFENHSWATHIYDRGREQKWAAGRSYEEDRYTENADGSGSGLFKFTVWDTRSDCSGAAYYYVTWTPVTR